MKALGGQAVLHARYALEEELGRGGGGVVYSARDRADGCAVAIKLAAGGATPTHPAAKIAHEHLVHVREAAMHRDVSYVVMERVEGCDLGAYSTRERRLPADVTISVMARVAEALAYLHARSLAHGDVKPANILFDAHADVVKLADFESADVRRPERGTPAYLAPEQVCGEGPGAAADQFAFGVTLYRLLTGVLPFEAVSLPRLFFSIAYSKPPGIRAHDAALPPAVEAVVHRTLEKSPRARYGSMRDVAHALRARARNKPRPHREARAA